MDLLSNALKNGKGRLTAQISVVQAEPTSPICFKLVVPKATFATDVTDWTDIETALFGTCRQIRIISENLWLNVAFATTS
jgi:hypothetical protein